jgi:hypothetical protein
MELLAAVFMLSENPPLSFPNELPHSNDNELLAHTETLESQTDRLHRRDSDRGLLRASPPTKRPGQVALMTDRTLAILLNASFHAVRTVYRWVGERKETAKANRIKSKQGQPMDQKQPGTHKQASQTK